MTILWLAVAAQLSAPVPTNDRLVTSADVPVELLHQDELKLVQFRVTVTPQGKAQDCQVEVSSGDQKIDSLTCALVKRRTRFSAATDPDGKATYGVYRAFITWWMSEDSVKPPTVTTRDLEVMVKDLPAGVQSPVPVQLMFAADASGHPSTCKGARQTDHPALVKIGCDQLVKSFTAVPAKTNAGNPVPSVQNAIVLFMKS